MEFKLANKNNLEQVYELVQETIKSVYPKYYLPEIVEMFSEYHCKDHVLQDILARNTYILLQGDTIVGTGTIQRIILPECMYDLSFRAKDMVPVL